MFFDEEEGVQRGMMYFFFYLFIINLLICLTLLFIGLSDMTGFASYLEGKGGSITEVSVTFKKPVIGWAGIYGFALRIPDFNELMYKDVPAGQITRTDLFFSCIKQDSPGGPEIFASFSPNPDLSSLTPATPAMVDALIGCSNKEYCASNTYKETMNITVGDTLITNIPATHTYRFDGKNNIFDIGILNSSDGLIFVSHINSSIQKGYSPNISVNFQMLLPIPTNETSRLYFFADPNDICPQGGFDVSINSTISGRVKDSNNLSISGAKIMIGGTSVYSDSNGTYNFSFLAMPGTYTVIVQKEGYELNTSTVDVTISSYSFTKDFTLHPKMTTLGQTVPITIYGLVTDTGNTPLDNVLVMFENISFLTNQTGKYRLGATAPLGQNPVIAIKAGYDNYYSLLNITSNKTLLEENITLVSLNENQNQYLYPTGPYTSPPQPSSNGVDAPGIYDIQKEAEIAGQDYWISAKEIKKQVRQSTFVEESISIYNFQSAPMKVSLLVSDEISDFVKIDQSSLNIPTKNFDSFTVTIYGTKPLGTYTGTIFVRGAINQEIPVVIDIVEKKATVETLLTDLNILDNVVKKEDSLKYKLEMQNLLTDQGYKIELTTTVASANDTPLLYASNETVEIKNALTLIREIKIPKNLSDGSYLLKVQAKYKNLVSVTSAPFSVSTPLYLYAFFGVPLWVIFASASFLSFTIFNLFLYKVHLNKKKRYHTSLDYNALPKKKAIL